VRSREYLGADLVLRCAVGSEQIVVRAEGRTDVVEGAGIALGWRPEDEHYFDAQGARLN
jgi:sn-glycerol 3-phosphate transport system ATP-binding protein